MRNARWIVVVVGLGMATVALADSRYVSLKTNPFLQPVIPVDGQGDGDGVDTAVAEMELRATMMAGQQSQANIGGVIVGLDEVVNGYRLVEVYARHVVLDRDGTRKELRIDDSDKTNRD